MLTVNLMYLARGRKELGISLSINTNNSYCTATAAAYLQIFSDYNDLNHKFFRL
ncbi:hypothetical protein SAMN06265348_108288 [Pedobacter westerhofensis]|uniref:Uncharacterized protein n=1 Tax=Pedobacter westerhofensis TaxID=425512 RepID=A0A521EMG6_9SPHI|nr:hypothetical protein SAMN06265348_108288 [Pedobacter westerhofensis]